MSIIGILLSLVLSASAGTGVNNNQKTMEQRITFITLGVEDLDISADFYENKFGWERSEMSNDNLIIFQMNGFHLALYSYQELAKDAAVEPQENANAAFRGFTLSHNVSSEKEVDNIISHLKDKGVKIVKEPQKVFWGGYSSYVADPDGNLWEIAHNPFLN